MAELPSGTVTFLFTDIEGSTRLLNELGAEAYAGALAEHRRVVRSACDRHGGVEVGTEGDSFFVAFATAPSALQAAGEAQGGLVAGPIRVRMGLHTGAPLLTDEGYVGVDVHRAARIAAAGHGGQVLVSAATATLADQVDLRDLGEHRLKDLGSPERVFQLGDGEFPPLKSLYRTNLPVPASSFLGRQEELADVVELLRSDDVRLLTLAGPGGTGKTRLALQAAAEASESFPDGLWWVSLAPLRDPTHVASALARALEVKEEPGRELIESLRSRLAGKRALLLLDNLEHLLPAAASTVAAVRDAGGPTVLVTSRERVQLQGEQTYAVPSLSGSDGIELFVARARQVSNTFVPTPAVAQLCARLDDLPLALELAAARTAVFSPEQLIERLSQRLDLLRGGHDSDPRQQTLRATIDWSYRLLEERERRIFGALSVFAGGCSYDAAEEVAGADPDVLQSLLDKSLLRLRDDGLGRRYWMLETIREYAADELREPQVRALRLKHAEYVAKFALRADPHLRHGPDQQGWVGRVAADYDNVRLAMQFALAEAPRLALEIVGSLAFFVWLRGGFAEARAWVEEALAAGPGEPERLRAKVLECGAIIAERQGDLAAAQGFAEAAYAAYDIAGDGLGKASALRELGKAASARGDVETARTIYEELARFAEQVGDRWNGAIALNNLGDIALYSADWHRTIELSGRSRQLRLELDDRWGAAWAFLNVILAQVQLGQLDDAARNLRSSLDENLAIGSTMGISSCLDLAAVIAAAAHDWERAAGLLGASERLSLELGTTREQFESDQRRHAEESTRHALGDRTYGLEWTRGRETTQEEAIGLALGALTD